MSTFKTRGSHDDIVDNKPPLGPLPKHVHSTKHEEFDPATPVKTVLIFADIDRADTFSAFTIDILPQKLTFFGQIAAPIIIFQSQWRIPPVRCQNSKEIGQNLGNFSLKPMSWKAPFSSDIASLSNAGIPNVINKRAKGISRPK